MQVYVYKLQTKSMDDKENIDPGLVSQAIDLPSPVAPINNNIDLPALATLIRILKADIDPQLVDTIKPTLKPTCHITDSTTTFDQLYSEDATCGDSVQDSALDMHGKPASKSKTGNWKACFLIFGTNNC